MNIYRGSLKLFRGLYRFGGALNLLEIPNDNLQRKRKQLFTVDSYDH